MQEGYAKRAQEVVRQELEVLLQDPESVPPTRLLATLVAMGNLEVKIASPRDPRCGHLP